MEQAEKEKTKTDAGPAGPSSPQKDHHEQVRIYFHKLRFRLTVGIIIAFLAPIVLLSIYFHFQFNYSLKESGESHLTALAESQRNTMDLFLQERVVNLFSLFQRQDFVLEPDDQRMLIYLQGLRRASDAFIDVGFFNEKGRQTGYAGPYPFLTEINYSGETWFKTLLSRDRNYYISDIYLGFRNKPHFTIAVKQVIFERPVIVRATLDPDKFYLFLRGISRGKGVESVVINDQGDYQIVDPGQGAPAEHSDYVPAGTADSGVEEVVMSGEAALVAYARLQEVPWILMVRQPLKIAYAQMYRARNIMIAATSVFVLLVVGIVILTTGALLRRAEETAEARDDLRYQLLQAGKLASVGELAAGVAHEINNPLAIIGGSSGVIRDYLDPEFGLEYDPQKIIAEIDVIDSAVFRARGITGKLLNFSRINEPKLVPSSINKVLEGVVTGFKEREFEVSNIKVVRDYARDLPKILLDPDQITQVFLNLVNNAGDAIEPPGTITLITRLDGDFIRATVADTGKGMTPEVMKKIFIPFFTTKEAGRGTGLGLAVSNSIVESLGGRIEVQSVPGAGSSFTVVLPVSGSPENG